jgi:hypothetical protein
VRLQARWPRNLRSIPGRWKRFFSTLKGPERFWGPHSLLLNGYWGLFPMVYKAWVVTQIIHLHLVLKIRMSGAISPVPYAFIACKGTTLPFALRMSLSACASLNLHSTYLWMNECSSVRMHAHIGLCAYSDASKYVANVLAWLVSSDGRHCNLLKRQNLSHSIKKKSNILPGISRMHVTAYRLEHAFGSG